MAQAETGPGPIRFGPFELDRTGELRKQGARIRLRGQPLQVLKVLLVHAGEVVTREDLRHELWADGTFVDFDSSISAAVRRLRTALDDEAAVPRFIETLPGQGYRFIEPVQTAPHEKPAAEGAGGVARPEALGRSGRRSRATIALSALAVLAVLGVLAGRGSRSPTDAGAGAAPATPAIHSLAVLPFASLSSNPEMAYFTDGMTDVLISDLAGISALRVVSRTSVLRYAGSGKSVPEIARELGVDAVVEGSILRSDGRVRITVQLIHGATDAHLWSRTYERELRDVLVLQGEVAQAIAGELRANLSPPERARLARHHQVDPEALTAYLKGRYFWNQRGRVPDALKNAIQFFGEAVGRDPTYAAPHAGLADAYGLQPRYGQREAFQRLLQGKQHALRALELEPSLVEARTALAKLQYVIDWDWKGANESFQGALAQDPGYVTAHHWYSIYLLIVGRLAEAEAEARRAAALDPASVVASGHAAWVLFLVGRAEEAQARASATLQMAPEHAPMYSLQGRIALQQSRLSDALAAFTRAYQLSGEDPRELAAVAYAHVALGQGAEARRILAELRQRSGREFVPPEALVLANASLRRNDAAFTWLGRSLDDRSVAFYLVDLRLDPLFEGLRGDPRLSDMFRKLGLDPPRPS